MSDKKPRQPFAAFIRDLLITGALFALPIGLTLWIVVLLFRLADNAALALLFPTLADPRALPFVFPGLGLALTLALITLLGAISAGVLGRFFLTTAEKLFLDRLPVVRNLYKTSKQVARTILSEHSKAFREAALLRYPHESAWSIAFVSARPHPEVRRLLGQDITTLFLPAVPNPTTGFLLFAEPQQWRRLDMSLEDALKFVVSGGIVQRRGRPDPAASARRSERHFGQWARKHFLGGLLIGLPVFFTLWLCWQIAVFLDNLLRPLLPGALLPSNPWIALPGVGILMTFVLVAGAWLARARLDRTHYFAACRGFTGACAVCGRGVFGVEMILDSAFSRSALAFRESVLFEYPHPGVWGIGFLTSDESEALRRSMGSDAEEMVNIFFPTTPNPTTGFFLVVPRSRVKVMEISLEEAFKLVLSIGTSADGVGE